MKKITRFAAYIFLIGLFGISCQDPPVAALDGAKVALKLASDVGALRYAEDQYRVSEKLLRDGWMEMAHQNGRLAPFRNYHNADSLLALAAKTARDAQRLSLETIRSLDSLARSERNDLHVELSTWRESLDGALENFQAERHWTSAEFALNQADFLIRKSEFDEARKTLQKGRDELRNMEKAVAEYANDEAQKIGVWRRWVNETLDESKTNGTYAIIIDKSAHKTYLVKSGQLVRSFGCELGYNSARQKLFAGDGATPEGTYYVTKVKHSSKFHKALLINFPNQVDLRRLRDNKVKGIISRYARAGALIEIHGEGGKNRDWTDGCIAMTNEDIDHLMQYSSVGMPVTIVRRSDLWP